jgi:hypothetical protein
LDLRSWRGGFEPGLEEFDPPGKLREFLFQLRMPLFQPVQIPTFLFVHKLWTIEPLLRLASSLVLTAVSGQRNAVIAGREGIEILNVTSKFSFLIRHFCGIVVGYGEKT